MTTTQEKAEALNPGQAMWARKARVYAIYLRRLPTGAYAILTGWAVAEGFDRDYLSEGAVAGLEGVCHDSWSRDYGANVSAAAEDYERLKALTAERKPLRLV